MAALLSRSFYALITDQKSKGTGLPHKIFWFVISVLFLHCFMAMAVTNLSTDESALLALKTVDPHNVTTYNWSSTSSVCNWVGISCGAPHRRVTALNLTNMGLQGIIPPHLGNLSFLGYLTASGNKFQGRLPEELSRLRRLKVINFNKNNLGGDLPSWFANLTSLQTLNLANNTFVGTIPVEIGNLTRLRILDLQQNQLSGPIPRSIFNMSSLENLALTFNNLSGSLPLPDDIDICHPLSKLKGLYLSSNQLNGQIPSSLGECSNLQVLSLSVNRFTGSIPTVIGNLTGLKQLFLGSNYLTGAMPNELSHLSNLEALSTPHNNLSGFIPSSIFNLSKLTLLDVTGNQLSGHLPSSIYLPNLEYFDVSVNNFSGRIPGSISNSSNLIILYTYNNSFSGLIPNTLGNLRMLQRLDITFNNLTADLSFFSSLTSCSYLDTLSLSFNPLNVFLPISIGNMSSIQYFMAGLCNIKGIIPVQIGNLSTMVQMELSLNELIGSIPSTLGGLKQLQGLSLSGNQLQGAIPNDICHLESLNYLYLESNRLSGQIPTCMPNLTSLRKLYLQKNSLSSAIPSSIWSLTFLLEVRLNSNSLNGSLPSDIGNLKALVYMDLSRNQISGAIPSSIGGLKDLQYLSLAENSFQGSIPVSFGGLVSLISLNLSANNLSGVIPKSLEALSNIKSFNVSSNRLQGEIPRGGPFVNFSAESFKFNDALCGLPRLQVPPCETITPRKSKAGSVRLLKYILPVLAFLSLVIAFTIIFIKSRKKRNLKRETQVTGDLLPLATWRRISFLELQQATDGFSDYNLLGTGSFGSVFRGSLSDGTDIAVKVFNLQVEGVLKSFDSECEVMRKIRHRNLVKIITSCCNIDFKALILEFMPNGSLDKWLYSHNYFLDFPQRLNIMIDVASALEYLHSYSAPIIHCDLKPSNILLDGDMVAHVGDFGIAKLLGGGDCICMTQTLTLATIGYMAPEYGQAGIVSTRGDVYSYGILMMETFTRKKPTDEMFSGEMNIMLWVKRSLPDAITEVVDSNLLRVERPSIAETDSVMSTLKLALHCCADLPEDRLHMKDVLSSLEKIRTQYLKDLRIRNSEC
ncbi:probable LRR receptor-like serine/threonine-protein kinase At3g47570 [Hevea brasiliensis]|uniref:probable LRR receptor-like serine/threonine-protein kinase At3g47570 n=1 Tax=Hevea brasiliensis TaxID=3981 RepID=UPI0025F024D3|nr:probable LRR receptor-like serine/threonine-protein kinase At3g47570 [Hevea brasiliensis]